MISAAFSGSMNGLFVELTQRVGAELHGSHRIVDVGDAADLDLTIVLFRHRDARTRRRSGQNTT